MRTSTVYLVGAGPGDPKLITVRGRELLGQADVVVYDHLVAPRLLTWCKPTAKRIYVGKQAGFHALKQENINALLVRQARAGRVVVRLKGGDPLLFGRGGEEALALAKAKISYEIVPGVTSAIAVPAYAGIPVTHRQMSSSVAIITGHEDPTKSDSALQWEKLATACDTLVCLMGVSGLAGIVEQLVRHGRKATTPCALIQWGTWPKQRTVTGTLQTIARVSRRAKIQPPAVLIVGDVVSLRKRMNWFEARPLFGVRVLVTRASEKAQALADALESLGAQVEQLPAIQLAPVPTNGAFKDAVRRLSETDWVFFTSPEGIGWFTRMLKACRKDVRTLSGCHIGAIGAKTAAAIEGAGLHVDFVPRQYSQEGLVSDLPARALAGKRALIFSAEDTRDVLQEGLRRRGMSVAKIPIYRTVMPRGMLRNVKAVFATPVSVVTVTSASCVDHLLCALKAAGKAPLFRTLKFASIGPVTSQAVRDRGGRVAVEAATSTIEGLIAALVAASRTFQRR